MTDYIDRQATIDKINERQRKLIYCFGFENDAVKIMDIAKSIVSAIPSEQPELESADVAPIIYGEWVIGGYTDFDSPYCSLDKSDINPTCHDKYYICNKCGHRPQKYFKPRAKYCPECGANMFAKKQEESNG